MGKRRREEIGLKRSEVPLHKREGSAAYRPKGGRKHEEDPLGDDYFVLYLTGPDSLLADEEVYKTYEEATEAADRFYRGFPDGHVEMLRMIGGEVIPYIENEEGKWVPESELED